MKQKQFIIREIRTNGKIEEIKVGENDLLRIYETWINTKLDERVEDIIKVDLPVDNDEAMKILKGSIRIDEVEYIALATTVGMMKHSDSTDTNEYSCEYFFINKQQKDFIKVFEDVVSLGKIEEKYETELCINKDIISRLSLAFSTGKRVYIPGIKKVILPEMTYKYVNNYLQFAEKDGKIDLDYLRLEKKENQEVGHIEMDGSGFIMPSLIERIQNKLNIQYQLSWIGIREIGVASKGLLVKFDWKKYLREEHGLNELIVKDMWGEDVNLFDVDVIQNETQVKWAKWFKNHNEIEELKRQDKYKAYQKLFEGFNITKYNKKEQNIYTEANYQILSNLALTPNKINILSKESEDIYSRVINGEVDATRIMLGDIAREEQDELSASTKIHKLLQLDEKMIKLQSMYKVIGNLVNKKINNLAGGGIYLKGNYKVILKDPLSYFDSIIRKEYDDRGNLIGRISNNGLQDSQNYVPRETGKRVLARCPLNTSGELIKTELVENKLFIKYFGELSSDICFYAFNDFMMRQSGADEDLDISFVIDENIIYDAVIDDIDEEGIKWYFRNQFDGVEPFISKFTKENMYSQILKVRGNKIGQLSNKGAIISNMIQEMPFYDNEMEDYYSYIDIKNQNENKLNTDFPGISKKEKRIKLSESMKKWNNFNNEEIKKGIILHYTDIEDKKIEDFIKLNFQKYKKYSYLTLYLQMVSIDAPKTNIEVSEEQLEVLNEIVRGKRKPLYIYYAKYKKVDKTVEFDDVTWSNSLLNNYAQNIIRKYGSKARVVHKKEYKNDRLFNMMKKDNNAEVNEKLIDKLTILNNEYNQLREEIDELEEIKNLKIRLATAKDEEIQDLNEKLKSTKVEKYNKIDVDILEKYKNIKNNYDYKEILIALDKVKTNKGNKISSRFIIQFAFEELIKNLLVLKSGIGYRYKLDKNGDIKYLYQNYSKEKCNIEDVDLTEKDNTRKKEKLGQVTKLRIGKLTHKKVTDKIKLVGIDVFNNYSELLGSLFKKVDLEDGIYDIDSVDYATKNNSEYDTAKSMSVFIIA